MKTWQRLIGLLLALLLALTLNGAPSRAAQAQDAQPEDAQSQNAPAPSVTEADWLEPRGLSIVDLVGVVPDSHLRDSIVVFTGGSGIVQYWEGGRNGDQVTVRVRVSPRKGTLDFTQFNCLGKRALYDEWPVAVPASEMRIFSGGRDISGELFPYSNIYPTGQIQPASSAEHSRYGEMTGVPLTRLLNGTWLIPANMGCTLYIPGTWTDLTAEFVFNSPQRIIVQTLGSETFNFHSYIGAGDPGKLGSLNGQMGRRYGSRHEKRHLNVPDGADFVWVNFPPTPVSAYISGPTDYNIRLPGSGTYRLASGTGMEMSVDHTVSQGLPLAVQYKDSDLSGGDYLPRLGRIDTLTGPEYFVPPGVDYDPCMREGDCSDDLLQRIWEAPIPVTVYYYKVSRVTTSQLTSFPLRQVAKGWDAAAVAAALPSLKSAAAQSGAAENPPELLAGRVRVALPFIYKSEYAGPVALPDDLPQAGCPCGWFEADGRMLDVIPGL